MTDRRLPGDDMLAEQRQRVVAQTQPDVAEPDATLAPPRMAGGGRRADMSILDMAKEQTVQRFTPSLNRQRVQAAVSFHLGGKLPGVEWTKAVDPIADKFIEMAATNPMLVQALESDVNAMFALTDADIADRISRGEPVSELGDVWDAIAEVSWEVGATDLAARFNAERADAMSGTFEALTATEALDLALDGTEAPAPGARFAVPTAKASSFQTLFDVPGAWSFSPAERTLAVTVGGQTIGVETRPGFNPENHLDVMAEVVAAQADGRIRGGELVGGQKGGAVERIIGAAHEIGHWLDEHPGVRTTVDGIWEGMSLAILEPGALGRLARGESEGPLGRASDRMRTEEGAMTEESIRQASIVPFPDDAVIGTIARLFVEESGGELSTADALSIAAETVSENRDQLTAEFEQLTSEELLEELEQDVEGRSVLGDAIESGLGGVLEGLETWDKVAHFVGVNFIDAVRDGVGIVFDDEAGGYTKVKDLVELQPFGTTAADYFQIDDPDLADGVNLAVSIGFDPTNLLFPGAKGLRAMATKALTNPKYAGLYLRTGQFPRIAKQIAQGTGRKSALGVFGSTSGMKDPEILDLIKIARDPQATVGQVNAVWTRAMYGDWLGEGFGRPIRHSTTEGMGRMLDSLAAGKLNAEHADELYKFFAKASTGRTLRLGENQSMDQFADLLVQFFPADPDTSLRLFERAAEARMAAGDDLALSGVTQAQKEQARRAAFEAGGTVKAVDGTVDVRGVSENLRTIEDTLANLSNRALPPETENAVRTQLNRVHSVMSRQLDDAAPKITRALDKKRLALKQVGKVTALEGDMAANAARNVMADQVFRLYDEVAEQINKQFGSDVIPVKKGKVNPLAPDVPVRDWSEVTGLPKGIAAGDKDLQLMMGLSFDNADLARQADAVGMFNRSQKMMLPASPYEVILFQKLGGTGAIARASQVLRAQRLKKITRGMKLAFGANLLVNPLTAARVTYDPTLRFLADTGQVGRFLHASAAGTPIVGGAADDLIRRVPKFRSKYGESVVNPWALPYKRDVGGWFADDFADYKWVMRPPRRQGLGRYREQVERWINGSLLNDRRFREYARWVEAADTLEDGTKIPPSGWSDWWDKGDGVTRPGKADVNPTQITIRNQVMIGDDLTSTDAFNILDRIFDNWLELAVDEKARPLMRERLLAAARGGTGRQGPLDVVKDARLLNAVERVPGMSGETGFGSQVFNVMFGAPAGRRAGVFYEHYFDEAFGILTARHGDRVLTVDKLMEFAKVDKPTAELWLKQGSENATVAQLIAETGARTEGQLAARAAAYAERRADDLEYRFNAASLAGRGVEAGLLMPFARAQVDFLSWWSDHMTKPLTTRFTLEQRAKMGPVVQNALQKFESIPINARAWAKYAHLVSTVNNEHESVIDQTIDNLTFFPYRFDSDFLLSVSPQLGPFPSWMVDWMIDKGVIGEEFEKNLEALFPALAFTELDDDIPGEMFNRVLPASRRSLRDFSVGMARAGYALFGADIHTDPGKMGQIVNILADGKVPAATGDFQAALVSDFLGSDVWNVVPGSDEWTAAIREIAIQGATEANRQEWSADWWDRVVPLAREDREYRSTRAFEGLFDDTLFGVMVEAGAFQANDLIEEDGVPRIKAVWDKYREGQATDEEMTWLDDRLTTAYFEAGRVDVLPGFNLRDYLHLAHPELAVNLINKSEDSGIPVRSDEHAEFKQTHVNTLTGRLQNVPPGETGREIIREARNRGWLVSRPVEEWATDASEVVYKSGQRAVRGVWESVSHRTWQQGLKKAIEEKTFTLPGRQALILQQAGLEVEAGTTYTYAAFHKLLDDFDERFDVGQPVLINTLERGAVHGQLAKHDDEFGLGLLESLTEADREFNKLGIESVEDWPEESKTEVRRLFNEAISLGYTTVKDYTQEIAPLFGPIDYQPPVPPPVGELETGLTVSGDELADMQVIDGDTLAVLTADGPMRVRVVGINAPELSQPGYAEARSNLEQVVAGASEVVFGIYKPELFGMTQLTAPGEKRLLAWMYVDGTPLFDPSVFTADNPRGAALGGNVLDLQAIVEAGRQ